MINKKNIRDYEVSIWTLQDSFITVLKPSHLENKGTIQEPKMILKDDGENSFSFKIPMYIYEDTNLEKEPYFKKEEFLIENPIWFNVRNGNLLVDMRKIKVIFNKKTEDEEIFEFIITGIKESHEGYSKYCEVTCGGLAFHELGKQGYNITLSEDDFLYEYEDWVTSGKIDEEPIENINYWVKKVLENSNWSYEIQMDWSLYNSTWSSSKIYKEPYVSSWKIENNILIPEESVLEENKLEKIQSMDIKESNRYNLLQKIAETFQVYCKYKYYYDDNYHIIDRKVIFYNNFLSDKEEIIDFTYGYNTSQITREIDSMDLVTKMFIKSMKDSGTFSGEIKLSDSAANKSLEEYLLNFDYLYKIGTITQDQYEEIKNYEKELHEKNSSFLSNSRQLVYYDSQLSIEEARQNNAKSLKENSQRYIDKADSEMIKVTSGKSSCTYSSTNPLSFILIKPAGNENNPYINLQSTFGELNQSSFQLYTQISAMGEVKQDSKINERLEFTIKDGLVTKVTIKNFKKDVSKVYATFEYKPDIPSKKVKQLWRSKQKQAEKEEEEAEIQVGIIKSNIQSLTEENESLKKEKQEIINKFERFMGPAIREGTWSPDDSYSNCLTNNFFSLSQSSLISNSSTNRNENVGFIWDDTLFENEIEISYPYGLDISDRYYPCINLSGINLNILNVENLNLVYRDYYWDMKNSYDNNTERLEDYQDPTKNHYLAFGAADEVKFVFLQNIINNTIIPALIILGARTLLDEIDNSIVTTPYSQVQKNARLSTISYMDNGNFIETAIIGESSLNNLWISEQAISNYKIVYPRFYNASLKFLTATPENMIYYGNNALEKDKDYYILFRADKGGHLAHYLTLKPESIMFKLSERYSFHYSLSTAADAIYLDALKILKENSTPKVSYSLTPLAKDESFIKNAYNRIGQLAHINDIELKFENVQGYISEVNLNLDKPWEDSYTIKNYKTKFEDLFSTIVAQTQAMQRNSQTFTMASNLFDNNGYINSDLLNKSINKAGNEIDMFELVAVTEEAMFSRIEEQLYKVTSDAALILNGSIGLAFPKTDTIEGISLNNEVGLRIDGIMKRENKDNSGTVINYTEIPSYFRVTNGAMGFFKKGVNGEDDEGMMYFDAATGDMALKGTLWAKTGGFGVVMNNQNQAIDGWLIETGTFKSLNNKAIFTSGGQQDNPTIILKNTQNEEIFSFNNGNLQITGTIIAEGGNIAGWTIGQNALYKKDNNNNEVIGMSPGDISFWAGGSASSAPFRVTNGGVLTAIGADISGEITATSGSFTGTVVVDSNGGCFTTNSLRTTYDDSLHNGVTISSGGIGGRNGNNYFHLKTDGTITASNVNISGGILDINNGTFHVNSDGTLTATGADISGTLTAGAGSGIGGWYVGQNHIGNGQTRGGSTVGMSWAATPGWAAFWAGGVSSQSDTNALDLTQTPFYVTNEGALHASNANITEGSYLGGWYIGSNYIGNGETRGKSKVGMSWVKNSGWAAFWAGGEPQSDPNALDLTKTPFYVTNEGTLSASKVKITGGEIKLTRDEKIDIEDITSYQYIGTLSLNQKHTEIIEEDTITVPFLLHLKETKKYEDNSSENFTLFYHEGELKFKETSISSSISTSITASRVSSSRFTTDRVELTNNGLSILNYSEEHCLETRFITSQGVARGGLRDGYEGNSGKWIIYKNFSNGNIYIEGDVYVRNSAGTGWKKISG